MKLSLPRQVQRQIDKRVKSGKYATPEDVVAAAVSSLEQQEAAGSFAAGELDELLAEGERSGKPLDGQKVLAEFRALRNAKRNRAG